jgi:hypothetical protein
VVYILVWSIKPAPLQVELSITGLPKNATRNATISGVDSEHANSYRGTSADSLHISSDQIQTTNDGKWTTTLNLPANSIRLIEITP